MMMMMCNTGLFNVDHTIPVTTTQTTAADHSRRSRSAEREVLPLATATTPDSTGATQTTGRAGGAVPTSTSVSSRLKSGVGAKGQRRVDFSTCYSRSAIPART